METGILNNVLVFGSWDPKYIVSPQNKRAKDIVTSEDWNSLFNRLIVQGDWNSSALDKVINTGDIQVKEALHSSDSDLLEGHSASYFAYRHNVIGFDEEEYSRSSDPFMPIKPKQPANKHYVDYVASHISDYTDEFDSVVYFDELTEGPEGPITIDQALRDGLGEVIHHKYVTSADITRIKREILDEVIPQGGGDMLRSVYDSNSDGVVDDSTKLGGIPSDKYLQLSTRGLGARSSISRLDFVITHEEV